MKSFRDYRDEERVNETLGHVDPLPPMSNAHDGGKHPLKSWQKKWLLDVARHYSFEATYHALKNLDENLTPISPSSGAQGTVPPQERPTNDSVSDYEGETGGGYAGGY